MWSDNIAFMANGRKNFAAMVVGQGKRIMVIGNGTNFQQNRIVQNNTQIECYLVDANKWL